MPAQKRRPRRRADQLLVERGLAASQESAQALILAGEVTSDGSPVVKPGVMVPEDAQLAVAERAEFVGRGGVKLQYALEVFGLDLSSRVAVDIGASTGGFTHCLLKRGARRVYAFDVGKGQLDWKLRQDSRVILREKVNARYPIELPESADLATIDVSFISATSVIPPVARVLKPAGHLVVLVKPQFEAEKREVGRGGVVRDPDVHARVLGRFLAWARNSFRLCGLVASPIVGAKGNAEFFVLLRKSPGRPDSLLQSSGLTGSD